MKNPALGILVILILWILIERCVKWFGLIDKLATRLLYPYWAWVSYATALNIGIWWLN
jgi:tryptophan-rich sensory protein